MVHFMQRRYLTDYDKLIIKPLKDILKDSEDIDPVAEKMNVTKYYLRDLLDGEKIMSIKTLLRICDTLDLDIKLTPKEH